MEENAIEQFVEKCKESINNKTFAKLTFAKTIGKPELINIFFRLTKVEDTLCFEVTFKGYNEGLYENKEIRPFEDLHSLLKQYLFQPFITVILFTTKNDFTLKFNKKRIAVMMESPATFKNPDIVFTTL